MMPSALEWDLRRQHKAFVRLVYDGHNRRAGLTTMHRLHLRRLRRTWRRRLGAWLTGEAPFRL
jgi:hypothetical protein